MVVFMAAENRHAKQTARFDSRELAKLTEADIVSVPISDVDDSMGEWDDEDIAAGTPPQPVESLVGRTMTVDDPMTTRLLAEVARRPTREIPAPTVEVDGDWVLTGPIETDPDDVAHIVDPVPPELDQLRKPAKR
jgi:hypothetical protein